LKLYYLNLKNKNKREERTPCILPSLCM